MRTLTPEFILENLAQGQDYGHFEAVVLFVDTAGFTPLTTALMRYGAEGAEIVAQIVAGLFTPLVEVVYHYGGFVAGFAGDAFKAIFPDMAEASYQRALTAAWQMHQLGLQQPVQQTRFGDFPFAVKITVADGSVAWRIWQGVESGLAQQAATIFGGAALEAALAADPFTQAGEVVMTPEVAAQLLMAGVTLEQVGSYFRLCRWPAAAALAVPVRPDRQVDTSVAALATRFFPATLLERQTQGEFRQVVTVFINLQTLPSAGEGAIFAATLFRLLAQYGGYICRIGQIGDRDQGGTFLLFWGAPTGHEQDVTRALHFILALQRAVRPLGLTEGTGGGSGQLLAEASPLRAGITTQLAYAGFVGSPRREEYTCYGAYVNLAARQMVMADWGEIWLDEETARSAGGEFECARHGAFQLKGFAKTSVVFRLLGWRELRTDSFYQGEMVGRQRALGQLQAALVPLASGKFAGVIFITGEAGIGKSRLVHELRQASYMARVAGDELLHSPSAPRHPLTAPQWFLGQTDEILRQPLNPFRYWLWRYFNQLTNAGETTNKAAFTAKLRELMTHWVTNPPVNQQSSTIERLTAELNRTYSFLGALIDLHWPDSLYTQLEPQLRFENTLTALKTLILAESLRRPVILHLEDTHWLDEASRTLLTRLTHHVEEYPFAIVMTTRPFAETGGGGDGEIERIAVEGPQTTIGLTTLTPTETMVLAEEILAGRVAPALVAFVQARAEGNPFFTEQLLRYLQEQTLLEVGTTGWQLRTDQAHAPLLPRGAQALLVARLDRLPQPVKEVVQTAAVLGREFDTHVLAQMLADDRALAAKLAVADRAAIWSAMTQARYLFRHALLREAAYTMQLRAQVRLLHQRAGAAIEQVYHAELMPYVGELAYHYDQAEQHEVAAGWYAQAGEQAIKHYANDDAARYFRRSLELTPTSAPATRYSLLLGSEAAHNWLGRRLLQEEELAKLEAVANLLGDDAKFSEVMLRKAAFHLSTGRYREAADYAEQAVALAVQAGDGLAEARARHRWGRAFWQAGAYQPARPHLESALALARAQQAQQLEAQSLYDLAMVDYYQKALTSALDHVQQASHLFVNLHDQQGKLYCLSLSAVILGEMGNYLEAAAQFEAAFELCRQIGLRYAEAHLLAQSGDNDLNLGALADAYHRHTQALTIYQEIDDKEGLATSLDTLGLLLAFRRRPAEAQTHYQQALTLHRAIHDQRGEGYVLTHLGYLLVEQQAWPQAAVVLETALALRRARAEAGLLLDTLAAYALVVAAREDATAALPYVDEILDWLAGHGLAGIEFPGQVYLSCYRVLDSLADAQPAYQQQAIQTLTTGYTFLQERAQRIQDATLRESFLHNLPFHRDLIALWQAKNNSDGKTHIQSV